MELPHRPGHWHVTCCYDRAIQFPYNSVTQLQLCTDLKWVPTGCKKQRLRSILNTQITHIFSPLRHQPRVWTDFFSREFTGSHHIDKNFMSKELRVSKQGDDAMRHFDQIPSWIWWIHPNQEEWLLPIWTSSRGGRASTNNTGVGM